MTLEERRLDLYTQLFSGTLSEEEQTKIHNEIYGIECKLMGKDQDPAELKMDRGQCFRTLARLGYCIRDQITIFHVNLAPMTGSERLNFLVHVETEKITPFLPTQNGCNRCDMCEVRPN